MSNDTSWFRRRILAIGLTLTGLLAVVALPAVAASVEEIITSVGATDNA